MLVPGGPVHQLRTLENAEVRPKKASCARRIAPNLRPLRKSTPESGSEIGQKWAFFGYYVRICAAYGNNSHIPLKGKVL